MEARDPAAGTSPGPSPRPDLLKAYGIALVVGIFLDDGLFRTAYFYFGELSGGNQVPLRKPLIEELTASVAVIVGFFAVVLPMARRWPLWAGRWRRRLPVHLAGLVTYSALKTLLIWWLRIPLWPLAGLGQYDYGNLAYRFPMEGAKDVFFYLSMVGVVQFWDA